LKLVFAILISLLSASTAYADYLFTEKNGNNFVWKYYDEEDGQYCAWLSTGKFCVPKINIASIKETGKGGTEIKKVADTKTYSYVPISDEREVNVKSSGSYRSSAGSSGSGKKTRRS
jgi:hypothetical protein